MHLKEVFIMPVCKERAWKALNELSFERVTGTENEYKAAKLIQSWVEGSTIEEYEIDMPEILEAKLEITKPVHKEYHVIGIGKTGSTPDEGIIAPFVYIENAEEVNMADVKGKICLATGPLTPKKQEMLAKKGALGYIVSHGSFYDDEKLIQELRPRNSRAKVNNMPGVVLHINDCEDLVRTKPEEVKLVLKQNNDTKGKGHNVVATIEGSDLKDEIVTFTAHYDSVPYSKGAWDNATGSITILELYHYFKESNPRRTLKFVWCGSEEIGLVGSKNYCKDHKDEMENTIYNINFDMTGVTLGYEHFCCSSNDEALHYLEAFAKAEGYPVVTKKKLYPSDSTSFAYAGVPSCTFARLAPNGGAQIHNYHDTMDHLDADSFMITLNFVIKYATQIINAPVNMIKREFDKKLQEKIDEHHKEEKEKEDNKDK